MTRALYHPGDTPVHRVPAGVKLIALAAFAGIISFSGWIVAGVGLVVLAAAWATTGLGLRDGLAALRPLWVFLLVILIAQAVFATVSVGLLVGAKLCVLVLAATLVTASTRTSDMIAVLEASMRPLVKVGVDVARASMLIVLAIRFLPALSRIVTDVREAQRARGLERQFVAAAVPILIRTLREADAVAEALTARGWPG